MIISVVKFRNKRKIGPSDPQSCRLFLRRVCSCMSIHTDIHTNTLKVSLLPAFHTSLPPSNLHTGLALYPCARQLRAFRNHKVSAVRSAARTEQSRGPLPLPLPAAPHWRSPLSSPEPPPAPGLGRRLGKPAEPGLGPAAAETAGGEREAGKAGFPSRPGSRPLRGRGCRGAEGGSPHRPSKARLSEPLRGTGRAWPRSRSWSLPDPRP